MWFNEVLPVVQIVSQPMEYLWQCWQWNLQMKYCKYCYHGLRTHCEEIAFTARPKINSHSQIFRYARSIFCLPHRPNFSRFLWFTASLGVRNPWLNATSWWPWAHYGFRLLEVMRVTCTFSRNVFFTSVLSCIMWKDFGRKIIKISKLLL